MFVSYCLLDYGTLGHLIILKYRLENLGLRKVSNFSRAQKLVAVQRQDV